MDLILTILLAAAPTTCGDESPLVQTVTSATRAPGENQRDRWKVLVAAFSKVALARGTCLRDLVADPQLGYYVRRLEAGEAQPAVLGAILTSTELATAAGGEDGLLAELVYRRMLGRYPSDSERDDFIRELAKAGLRARANAVREMLDSNEHRWLTIALWHDQLRLFEPRRTMAEIQAEPSAIWTYTRMAEAAGPWEALADFLASEPVLRRAGAPDRLASHWADSLLGPGDHRDLIESLTHDIRRGRVHNAARALVDTAAFRLAVADTWTKAAGAGSATELARMLAPPTSPHDGLARWLAETLTQRTVSDEDFVGSIYRVVVQRERDTYGTDYFRGRIVADRDLARQEALGAFVARHEPEILQRLGRAVAASGGTSAKTDDALRIVLPDPSL